MARNLCLHCQRPTNACICDFICDIDNTTPVLVLQHPNEVKHSKGTVALLQRSLSACQVFVGENFSEHTELNELLTHYQGLLLYPSEQAQVLQRPQGRSENFISDCAAHKPKLLIILDGTWRKAYRMLMLSPNIQALTQICLPEQLANNGQYLIRKVAKKNALSSLEATCYALALLDGELHDSIEESMHEGDVKNPDKIHCGHYQVLLDKFAQFNHFQLSFRK